MELLEKIEHIIKDCQRRGTGAVTALGRPETLFPKGGRPAFVCFKAFKYISSSFYTVQMHYFQCLDFYMWRLETFFTISVTFFFFYGINYSCWAVCLNSVELQ